MSYQAALISLRKTIIFTSVFLSLNSVGAQLRNPIDGYDPNASEQNKETLKSVIKLETGAFFSRKTCSSTLISKNILLTAQHCADELVKGEKITLNENGEYRVVDVVIQQNVSAIQMREAPLKNTLYETNTDVALVLFESTNCAKSEISTVSPLRLVSNDVKEGLSNRILIAGYGLTQPDREDGGTLHSGYTEWDLSDYSESGKQLLEQAMIRDILRRGRAPEDGLVIMADRTDVSGFVNLKGQKLAMKSIDLPNPSSSAKAHPLQGDSGGPAIAFDRNNTPYVVGVASLAGPYAMPLYHHLQIVDTDTKEVIETIDVTPIEEGQSLQRLLRNAMVPTHKILLEKKFIDLSNTVLKGFAVIVKTARVAMGQYASVLSSLNFPFITENLSKFEKARDAANYCQ
jgi:hypothetical protein